jgi:hypothetical protein
LPLILILIRRIREEPALQPAPRRLNGLAGGFDQELLLCLEGLGCLVEVEGLASFWSLGRFGEFLLPGAILQLQESGASVLR